MPLILIQTKRLLPKGGIYSFGGGIPLKVDGNIIGAIGVSGGTVKQDQAICEIAVDMFTRECD
ncbi:hypothetical protein B8W86_09705 [Lactobacillus kefiranofaciens]|nr:heme-binding protein [Lactobacillus kefiranofaciens]PAK97497.1 hypothetical protein B8W86_09705 [Lactobacillus kefiranofaciens]QFQ68854.1 heme-binding protein [Lactobacillus kefiranofaciens subsp. kefiranofaciens]QNT45126.1 heme-binding protein [Lactobacillus kefiranofaciens]